MLGVQNALTASTRQLTSAYVSWLHISDLHFTEDDDYNRKVVTDAYWRDLERLLNLGNGPDFIAVTGDVAYSGKEAEYQRAMSFFDQLLKLMQVGKDKLFIVPGNHDVDRSKIKALGKNADTLRDRNSVTEALDDPLQLFPFHATAIWICQVRTRLLFRL